MANPLKNWLMSCNKIVKDSSIQNVTHFMLDGGKLDLSEDYDTFQELYAKYIKCKNCIVERKTEIFKLFIDFDFLCKNIIDINDYIICIQDCINDIYNKTTLCIVSGTDVNKIVKRENTEYIKQGYHLHWPEILVDKKIALRIRKLLVVRLTTIFGKNENFYDSWEKIVDKCVYEQNGLRLLGSDKCSYSDGNKEYENRVYIIKSIYMGNKYDEKTTDLYINDTLLSVKNTSIRTNATGITHIVNLPEYEETEDEDVSIKSGFTKIQKDSKEYKAIEKFFRNYVSGYRFEDIRHVLKVKDHSMYIIDSKSKYCQNIDDFHTNNHIFFRLTPSGFCQKCRSERDGNHGCCRDYNSNFIPLTTTLQSVLEWKTPKSKDISKPVNFSISNMLERMENNITGKAPFKGPSSNKK